MDKKDKIILFIGNADTEGATAKLDATNTLYKRKMLESSIDNWHSISSYFDDYDVTCAVIKLTKVALDTLAQNEYSAIANELLNKISKKPNLILAHEGLLLIDDLIDVDVDAFHYKSFQVPSIDVIETVNTLFNEYGLKITPYRKNAELSVLTSSFIEKNEHNLIFRIYVPSERIWASEAEKLLELFRGYLQKISGFNARHDQYKTNSGVIHEFFGDNDVAPSSLSSKFEEFSSFMDACVQNPEVAKLSLSGSNLNNREVIDLVSRYAKEARRIQVDLKHERERKLLNIRHELESELTDFVVGEEDWQALEHLVDSSIPMPKRISNVLDGLTNPLQRCGARNNIFINSQIIQKAHGVIAKEITGTVNLPAEAQDFLKAIKLYAGSDKAELTSAVHELNDSSVPETDRITAKQKLKGFLILTRGKLGDVATGIFQTFIESQIGL